MLRNEQLERGRALCAQGDWRAAHSTFAVADRASPLAAGDLELLAVASYMLGREEEYVDTLTRAHQAQLDAEATEPAAQSAFWLGMHLVTKLRPDKGRDYSHRGVATASGPDARRR